MDKKNTSLVLALFLLGIFMGAIDSGIITPAREIIQNGFGVSQNLGVWMVTIYTLSYAVSMPIVSKMGDRLGYKRIYTFGIAVFAVGSLLCGLNNFFGSFEFFLAARVIQAIGAGGIIPIANTVIGQSFPEEKRGMALGLVGSIYGVANIIGPTLGSAILSIAGNENWGWVFFINVPISIVILLLSTRMVNTKGSSDKPVDLAGAVLIAGVVGSLMYGLTQTDFFHFGDSIRTWNVYLYYIIFLVLLPILVYVESRAKDPILNIRYFKNRQMLVIFLLALVVGMGMMGMVFVPQFAENVLKIPAGTGGYLVTLLAVFSGVSAALSGKLLDTRGTRFVMATGFAFTLGGALVLGYAATEYLNFVSIVIGLALMGFGVGFTLGAPLNYLVLQTVPKKEGASGLATMSLIRSIGVAISPSIMIGFIVRAGNNLGNNFKDTFSQAFTTVTAGMQGNAASGMPNMADMKSMFSGDGMKALQSADVTNIVDMLKTLLKTKIPAPVSGTVVGTIEKMRSQIEDVFQSTLNQGYTQMFTAAAVIAALGFLFTFLLKKPAEVPAPEKQAEADQQRSNGY